MGNIKSIIEKISVFIEIFEGFGSHISSLFNWSHGTWMVIMVYYLLFYEGLIYKTSMREVLCLICLAMFGVMLIGIGSIIKILLDISDKL